mmetsp:Transcript_14310/g.39797  ORF Transcript_14310/g.39797 Transcript_14310/m.39797 type:complete len:548 (+) Transcript_14310:135-1778(+)
MRDIRASTAASRSGLAKSVPNRESGPSRPAAVNEKSRSQSVANVAKMFSQKQQPDERRRSLTRLLSARSMSNKIPKMYKTLQSALFTSPNLVPNVLEDCLTLIHDRPDFQFDLGQHNNAVATVVKIMQRCEAHAKVQELCCAIFRDLCQVHDENRIKVAEEGGLQGVLVALLTHEKPMELQCAGMHALANLSLNFKCKELIAELNGLEVLKTCLQVYSSDLELLTQASRVTAEMATIPPHSRALAALGIAKAVVKGMPQFPGELLLQLHACSAIKSLTETYEVNRGQLASAGAIPSVLKALKRFPADARLQAAGCGALWNMCIGHSMNGEELMKLGNKNGEGFRLVLNALKRHPGDPQVQGMGCGVIKLLTEDDHHANEVGKAGGLAPILTAMRQHETEKLVQAQGCGALCNLAMIDANKGEILMAGGIGMIIIAMQQLVESADVQKSACRALKKLAEDEQNKISIGASGGIAAMLTAMDKHSDSTAVQVLALSAIEYLVAVPRNRHTVLNNDGVKIIERAMRNNPHDKFMEKTGWAILELLMEAIQ